MKISPLTFHHSKTQAVRFLLSSSIIFTLVTVLLILTFPYIVYAQDPGFGGTGIVLKKRSGLTVKPIRNPRIPIEIEKIKAVPKDVRLTSLTGSLIVVAEATAVIRVVESKARRGLQATVPAGKRTVIFNNLRPGRYSVLAQLNGLDLDEVVVDVTAGKASSVELNVAPFQMIIYFNVSTGLVLYAKEGEKIFRVVPINDNIAVLPNLSPGKYIIECKPEDASYSPKRISIDIPTIGPFFTFNVESKNNKDSNLLSVIPSLGRFYALVIGNNAYRVFPQLKTAEHDAQEVEAVLRKRYGFETKLLLNANRQQIISALNEYRRKLDSSANLLIYYAGHGYNDTEVERAYWLPVDAQKEDNANWISADDITLNIKAIPAKHVLVIADSCYSGTIERGIAMSLGEPAARIKYLLKMSSGKSRTLMASGGNEPVADSGGEGEHSVFAGALLRGLNKMDKDIFTAEELYYSFIREVVTGRSNQTPEYNPLRNSGHESGDFVFLRNK